LLLKKTPLKTVVLLNIFVEPVIDLFFMNKKFKRTAFISNRNICNICKCL